MAEYGATEPGSLQAILQLGQAFPVFRQKSYGNPMHCAVLADFSRCLHVRKRRYSSPSDLGNLRLETRAVRGKQHTPMDQEKPVDEKRTVKFIWRECPPVLLYDKAKGL